MRIENEKNINNENLKIDSPLSARPRVFYTYSFSDFLENTQFFASCNEKILLTKDHIESFDIIKLQSKILDLQYNENLILDFKEYILDSIFMAYILEKLFFPKYFELPTNRFVKDKKVLLGNIDDSTLLSISQCLEIAHANCMIIPNLDNDPWELVYAGHIEQRLKNLLEKFRKHDELTIRDLIYDTQEELSAEEIKKKTINFRGQIGELADFGLINRENYVPKRNYIPKQTIVETNIPRYRYTLYHPQKIRNESFVPTKLAFSRSPRPKRKADLVKEKKEDGDISKRVIKILSIFVEGCEIDMLEVLAECDRSDLAKAIEVLSSKEIIYKNKTNSKREKYSLVETNYEIKILNDGYLLSIIETFTLLAERAKNNRRGKGADIRKYWEQFFDEEYPNIESLVKSCLYSSQIVLDKCHRLIILLGEICEDSSHALSFQKLRDEYENAKNYRQKQLNRTWLIHYESSLDQQYVLPLQQRLFSEAAV